MADESPEVASILKPLEPVYKQVGGGWMQAVTTLCRNVVSRHGDLTISV